MSSLSQQRQAVEHLYNLCKSQGIATETVLEQAMSAAKSIGWFERREGLVRELVRLDAEAPYLAELMRQFPGSQVKSIRNFMDENYEISRDA